MLIIWSGLGFLGLLIPMALFAAGWTLGNKLGGPGYSATHGWPGSLGIFSSAVLLVALDFYMASRPGRLLVDPKTGSPVMLKKKHTIFFMPLRFFAGLILVWAVWAAFHPQASI